MNGVTGGRTGYGYGYGSYGYGRPGTDEYRPRTSDAGSSPPGETFSARSGTSAMTQEPPTEDKIQTDEPDAGDATDIDDLDNWLFKNR